jgi:hypothetical protein
MEEKKQEIKEGKSGIEVLDQGVPPMDETTRGVCCGTTLFPIRAYPVKS